MDLEYLFPSLCDLASAPVCGALPEPQVLLLVFGVRENAELGLARNEGQSVIRELDYHLAEGTAEPFGPNYLQRVQVLNLSGLDMVRVVH